MNPDILRLYQLKLYTLLVESGLLVNTDSCGDRVTCLSDRASNLSQWDDEIRKAEEISKASDRVNFERLSQTNFDRAESVPIRHLISAQPREVANLPPLDSAIIDRLNEVAGDDAKKAFWWLWRFYPEYLARQQREALLFPASHLIPDCPLHSYHSTVSAIVGAIPENYKEEDAEKHPYLLLFTFSPVQEFIKSSRKFLDFWAGSYLLHYLSAKLCWYIADIYGPDAIITPSLWSQEIIDALIMKQYQDFERDFRNFQRNSTPVSRFEKGTSTSLSTAGFPNVITAIVPGKEAAKKLGEELCQHLKKQWQEIGEKVRSHVRKSVINYLNDNSKRAEINEFLVELARSEGISDGPDNPNRRELEQWKKESNWQWGKLWNAQIDNTWEPYWTAVPLGYPEDNLSIAAPGGTRFDRGWIDKQETVAPSRSDRTTPTDAEDLAYEVLNIGTWWANSQSRLGQAIQAIKNTRNWRIPAAPGERSTISGQFSAIHPYLKYGRHQNLFQEIVKDLREGAGVSSGSMQLFWGLMALVYPGLFNGSEKLNALELTKRMAWQYGGVAEALGIDDPFQIPNPGSDVEDANNLDPTRLDYETLIRFPNLSSIAAARFAKEHPELLKRYWDCLWSKIKEKTQNGNLTRKHRQAFYSKTRRSFQVPNADRAIEVRFPNLREYNGVMFSSKWLIDDMGLNEKSQDSSRDNQDKDRLSLLRNLVADAHKECGFGDSSPADWWAIIVADGDGMGKYVSGSKLKNYQDYIERGILIDEPEEFENLLNTPKRMGPATHVGLNRALLDFSNRIVPYLTEQRFCGKVVYSGGDDVLAVLPLADLPEYLLCLRAAWCGDNDPYTADPNISFTARGGYWEPNPKNGNFCGLPNRPLFTMGEGATMSAGIVIAYKSVPLPTVLESLWSAEEDCAKEMKGTSLTRNFREEILVLGVALKALVDRPIARAIFVLFTDYKTPIAPKDGFCFRVIYGGGNVLEASMKGHLLSNWWQFISDENPDRLAPVLYRLAEELPAHAALTKSDRLLSKAARVIINSRDEAVSDTIQTALYDWLNAWEDWAKPVNDAWEKRRKNKPDEPQPVGSDIQDLAKLLRFSAFWLDKKAQQQSWSTGG